jgi:DnaA family protein
VSDAPKQLPLNFKQGNQKSFKDFISTNNIGIIDSLKGFSQSGESLLYLWGETGSGKSHLLHALIQNIKADDKSAVVLMPEDIAQRQNLSLIDMFDYICIDEVERVAKDSLLEESLFQWINEIRQARKKIILASQVPNMPEQWQLPDLCSRLQSGRTHQLKHLDRAQVLLVFKNQAETMGIVIDQRIERYLQNNCSMNMKFLTQLLLKLDQATLVHKKHITIPLLKKILNK